MFLAGDIGGTKTDLALFEESGDGLRPVREEIFSSQAYATFDLILAEFSGRNPLGGLCGACFGVAGVVVDGRCQTTNLPWVLDERALADGLEVPRVKLLNDLEAAAYGMLFLRPEQVFVLQPGRAPGVKSNVAVIAAGTGLGEAMLYWDGTPHHPIASEGGHGDFAPRTPLEIELLRYLTAKFGGHVSYERVLSGPGFHNIYQFLRDCGHGTESPEMAERLAVGDPNATIADLGLSGADPLCVATVELFTTIYGAEAGNLALRSVATGGVFVGGGIAPKLLPALRQGTFQRAFVEKGRYTEFMRKIAVSVALDPRAPLLGAAHYAQRLC
jgi:glucokinase